MELLAFIKIKNIKSLFIKRFLLLVVFFVLSPITIIYANSSESKYFEIILPEGVDLDEFYAVIFRDNFTLEEIIAPLPLPANLEQHVLMALDSLYLEVANILDIQPQGFKTRIEVYLDKSKITETAQLFSVDNYSDVAIYVFMQDTIFISIEDLTSASLGHEIARAIISHYFVVPPPEKVLNILTGYVDMKLGKE
ncbi:MAG: hypothetical protein K8S27_07115 [Candidatus Omnitrophica bacterium]|nr:hypothetical protein [Candidatus Omnitrophota bacterium]